MNPVAAKVGHHRQLLTVQCSELSIAMPFHYAPQPNCRFNADANIGHAFGIFMAYVGTLRTSCSGAG